MMNFRKFLKLCKAKDPYALQTRSVMLTCFLALIAFCSIEICGWFMGLVEPSLTAVFWMLFGFTTICFSLGIFIAWYEYKQCNGIQPLIPDYQYRKIKEILNEDNVEKRSNGNLIKTRRSELMKHYPNVVVNCKGVPIICPKEIDKNYSPCNGCGKTFCNDCIAEYWMQNIEEDK